MEKFMKKLVFTLIISMLMVIALAVSVSAETYNPETAEELNAAINAINASEEENTLNLSGEYADTGSVFTLSNKAKLNINLLSDVTFNDKLYLTGKGTVVAELNAYSWHFNVGIGGGNSYTAMELNNTEGTFEISNGSMTSTDVGIWHTNGNLVVNNMYINSTEEAVYGSGNTTYRNLQINGGEYYAVVAHDLRGENIIRNCKINNYKMQGARWSLEFDCWDNNSVPLRVYDTELAGQFVIKTGRHYVEFYDCTIPTIVGGSDGGGESHVYVITSPTCTENGTKTVYVGTSAGVLDETYEAPATGHIADISELSDVKYSDFYSNGTAYGKCAVCGEENISEETPSLAPIFILNGYSAKIGGTKITISYAVNNDALDAYNRFNTELVYGVVAYAPDESETDVDPINDSFEIKDASRTVLAVIDSDYVGFDFILDGFGADYYDSKIVMSAFVYDGEKVYYLGTNAQSDLAQVITFTGMAYQE